MFQKRFKNQVSHGGVPSQAIELAVSHLRPPRQQMVLLDEKDEGLATSIIIMGAGGNGLTLSLAAKEHLLLLIQEAGISEVESEGVLANVVVSHNLLSQEKRANAATAMKSLTEMIQARDTKPLQWEPSSLANAMNARDELHQEGAQNTLH